MYVFSGDTDGLMTSLPQLSSVRKSTKNLAASQRVGNFSERNSLS